MPLQVGCSRSVVRKNAAHLRRKGYEPGQAWAIANDLARKYKRMCKRKRREELKRPKKKKRRRSSGGGFLGIF